MSGPTLVLSVWNGSLWTASMAPVGATITGDYHPGMAVAFEQRSGNAIAVSSTSGSSDVTTLRWMYPAGANWLSVGTVTGGSAATKSMLLEPGQAPMISCLLCNLIQGNWRMSCGMKDGAHPLQWLLQL